MSGTDPGPSKPRKFKPTVPQRRRKAEDNRPEIKVEADDGFKELMRAAQEPANWERAHHGHGRRQHDSAPQQTVFGGSIVGNTGRGGFASTSSSLPAASRGGIQTAAHAEHNDPASKADPKSLGRTNPDNLANASKPAVKTGKSSGTAGRRLVKAGENGELTDIGVKQNDKSHTEQPDLVDDMLDYESYYPTMLPMRPPGSLLEADEADSFEAALPSDLLTQEEEEVNVAEKLGLLDLESRMDASPMADMLFQFPSVLPVAPAEANKSEALDRRKPPVQAEKPPHLSALSLTDLPPGKIGKLLIFESGKVKLQMGEILFDVNLGSECQCFQQVLATNLEQKKAAVLGEIAHRAICTPDMDHLLSNEPIQKWKKEITEQLQRDPRVKKQENPSTNPEKDPMDIDDAHVNGGANITLDPSSSKQKGPRVVTIDEDDDDEEEE